MTNRSLAEWLELLEQRHPCEIDLGVKRVAKVWQRYKTSQSLTGEIGKSQVITVAGTNGKGSCIATMQSILLAHNYSVGSFTSPHFHRYNERICINGFPVDDPLIIDAFETIECLRQEISLTYFEFNALAALIIFSHSDLDVVLLEVGLGGRLDAANIINANIAVLSSVDLDHQQWLGDTRAKIAKEKLGIARANHPLIIGETNYPEGFEGLVADTRAKALWLGRDFEFSEQGQGLTIKPNWHTVDADFVTLDNLSNTNTLAVNKTLALQALVSLGCSLDADKCRSAINSTAVMGRQQNLSYRSVPVILDVAHNPAAAAELAAKLRLEQGETVAVASVLEDKDWSSMVSYLKSEIDYWHIAELTDISRAAKGQSLLKLLYNAGADGTLDESIEQSFQSAILRAGNTGKVVVFGSFHTVAAVLDLIAMEVTGE
jgi:dihydrofolate synthase/folylpolyglutamate synthase